MFTNFPSPLKSIWWFVRLLICRLLTKTILNILPRITYVITQMRNWKVCLWFFKHHDQKSTQLYLVTQHEHYQNNIFLFVFINYCFSKTKPLSSVEILPIIQCYYYLFSGREEPFKTFWLFCTTNVSFCSQKQNTKWPINKFTLSFIFFFCNSYFTIEALLKMWDVKCPKKRTISNRTWHYFSGVASLTSFPFCTKPRSIDRSIGLSWLNEPILWHNWIFERISNAKWSMKQHLFF